LRRSIYIISFFAAGNLNQRIFISQININLIIQRLLDTSGEAVSSGYSLSDDHHTSLNSLFRYYKNKGTLALPILLEKLIFKILYFGAFY